MTTKRDVPARTQWLELVPAWAAVGLPLLWGVTETIRKTFALFR